jgi:hypothetical protein
MVASMVRIRITAASRVVDLKKFFMCFPPLV